MPSKRPKGDLDGSWIVEDEDEENDPAWAREESPQPSITPSRRQPRRSTKSPTPEFTMPRVHANGSLEASWMDERDQNAREFQATPIKARRRVAKSEVNKESTASRSHHDNRPRGGSAHHVVSSTRPPTNALHSIVETTIAYGSVVFRWCLEVFGGALHILKTPIIYLLAVWLLFGAGIVARNLVTNPVYASLSPICRIPGASLLNLPFCPVYQADKRHGVPPPVEFEQLIVAQSKFEEVLEESAGGVSLPMDMKRGEASIRDLRQLVRYSQLHARNELVLEFDGFIETARIASYDLQKFNSHVGRAVDSVISTTRWTARVLDGIQEKDASRGLINAFISDKILAPFQPIKWSEGILLDQYIQHTRIIEEEIAKLIGEAQALLMVLNNLDDRLDVIHGITTREDGHARGRKDEILSELWTMVGGNRKKISKVDRQLNLLQQVGIYRKVAFAHVSGTILRLQAIGAELENLRENVGAPELLRDRSDIPLSIHLENINRGIERLEDGRSNARKLENEQIKSTLERTQMEGTLIDR